MLVAFQGVLNAGPATNGLMDCVGVAVVEVVGVSLGVRGKRHGTYAGALHSPGCRTPPTQQSQQGDADAGHRPQSYCAAAREAQSSSARAAARRAAGAMGARGSDTRVEAGRG